MYLLSIRYLSLNIFKYYTEYRDISMSIRFFFFKIQDFSFVINLK